MRNAILFSLSGCSIAVSLELTRTFKKARSDAFFSQVIQFSSSWQSFKNGNGGVDIGTGCNLLALYLLSTEACFIRYKPLLWPPQISLFLSCGGRHLLAQCLYLMDSPSFQIAKLWRAFLNHSRAFFDSAFWDELCHVIYWCDKYE